MKNTTRQRSHIDPVLLAGLVDRAPYESLSRLAECHIGMSKGYLHDLVNGRRAGTSEAVRQKIADTLGVPAWSFTCTCEDLASHRPTADA